MEPKKDIVSQLRHICPYCFKAYAGKEMAERCRDNCYKERYGTPEIVGYSTKSKGD